jgi:hypothetical protein
LINVVGSVTREVDALSIKQAYAGLVGFIVEGAKLNADPLFIQYAIARDAIACIDCRCGHLTLYFVLPCDCYETERHCRSIKSSNNASIL